MEYFSDREVGGKPATSEEIPVSVWNGIIAIFEKTAAENAFSGNFSERCRDNGLICGFNSVLFEDTLKAEIPNIDVPIKRIDDSLPDYWRSATQQNPELPNKYSILDFVQFCFLNINDISQGVFYPFFSHFHLNIEDTENNKNTFRQRINKIFERNGIVFYLDEDGSIKRKVPTILQGIYRNNFNTTDARLNELLHEACSYIVLPKFNDRIRSLEKLWDAFERAKTYYGSDKKASVDQLLELIARGNTVIKSELDKEAKALSIIGNQLQIRHFETDKIEIKDVEHIDWLFFRMFSLINLFLARLEE